MTQKPDFDVLLLDIEGTTTPISFVHAVLFPFAREHIGKWLQEHWDQPSVQSEVTALRLLATADRSEGRNTPLIPETGTKSELIAATVATCHSLMDHDRKVTPLKSLQGQVWRDGYATGELNATLFDDVADALRRLSERVPIYIYSSGSIAAQKLLFAHTEAGDLTPLLSGYFDTTTGSKKERDSYVAIAQSAQVDPGAVLFLTDVVAEANCASAAGMQTGLMDRPGNPPQPEHQHPVYTSFDPLI